MLRTPVLWGYMVLLGGMLLAANQPAWAQSDSRADAVLSHYVEASGGAQRLAAERSRVTDTLCQAGWLKMSTHTTQLWPDRVLTEGKLPIIGSTVTSGYDGTAAWAADKGGPRRLQGRELQEFVLHNRLDRMTRLFELYPKRRLLPAVVGADAVAPRVEMSTSFGTQEIWTFDPKTGLLRTVEGQEDAGPKKGVVDMTVQYEDYRTVDGLTLPFQATIQGDDSKLTLKITKLESSAEASGIAIAAPADLKQP